MARKCNVEGCTEKHYARDKCRFHYKMPSRQPKVGDIIETEEGTMRVVDIKPSWENKPIVSKGGKAIPFMSEKHKKRLAEYRVKRDHYFKSHPVCEFQNCGSREITLHHMKGRIGKDLTDDRYFKSLCHNHHLFVEENPTEALKMGLSKKRLDK